MSKLNALKIKSITRIGMHSDGGGLHLKVQKSKDGSSLNKSWIYRWGAQGKNSIGLGSFTTISLADARELASECRKMVAKGLNPRDERDKDKKAIQQAKASAITFKAATKKYIEIQKASWSNEKHAQQWANTLEQYADPIIGNVAVSEVTKDQVLEILLPIWTTKNETATRVRGRIEKVLGWAIAKGYRTTANAAAYRDNLQPLSTYRGQNLIEEVFKSLSNAAEMGKSTLKLDFSLSKDGWYFLAEGRKVFSCMPDELVEIISRENFTIDDTISTQKSYAIKVSW